VSIYPNIVKSYTQGAGKWSHGWFDMTRESAFIKDKNSPWEPRVPTLIFFPIFFFYFLEFFLLLKSMNDNNNRLSNRQRRCRWYRNLEIVCIYFFRECSFTRAGACWSVSAKKETIKKDGAQTRRSNNCDVKQKTNSKGRIHAGKYTHSRGTKNKLK